MEYKVFKRKIYDSMHEQKEKRSDKYALFIRGERRVGKSTVVEEFAKSEFKSYIKLDFAHISKELLEFFDDTYNLDFFFLKLQQLTGKRLYDKESVIIFDEVQLFPKARQAIKYLVADGNKICPIEVKCGNYRSHKSLDVFCDKFSHRIKDRYVVHTKDYRTENGVIYLPVYMVPFL